MEIYLEIMIFSAISIALLLFFLLKYSTLKKHKLLLIPRNWPLVGMLPHLLLNLHRFYDWCLDIVPHIHGTFLFKGPWFTSMNVLLTVDPANVHYIMSKNFANFPKGAKQAEMFEILGDGIFNVDFESWKYQRRSLHSFLTHPRFNRLLVETIEKKVEIGLIPILDHACRGGHVVDLEDLFQRFTFDTICTLVIGHDPSCLSIELPDAPVCKALNDVEEVLFHRYVVPESIWKLQRWLGVGKEGKLRKAWETLDSFLYEAVETKREEVRKERENINDDELGNHGVDFVALCLMEEKCTYHDSTLTSDKFLRDMFLNMLIAGRDTTSVALTWFFWLIFKNPHVENMVREEINSIASQEKADPSKRTHNFPQIDDVSKMVYLHGALCETLRLYPSVPIQVKTPLKPDVLPSGHRVNPKTKVMMHLHAMGREKSIWGEDCFEFKPERWITEQGKVKHEPSFKFFAFNAGPRTCLGKEMAFIQMKAIVSTILLHGYHLQVVEEHEVEPHLSIILHTKQGLKAKVLKAIS